MFKFIKFWSYPHVESLMYSCVVCGWLEVSMYECFAEVNVVVTYDIRLEVSYKGTRASSSLLSLVWVFASELFFKLFFC